jgi:hypothetical protein
VQTDLAVLKGTIAVVVRLFAASVIVAAVLLLDYVTAAEAKAEITYLSCTGTLRTIRAGVSSPEEPWSFSLIVDTERKTIRVGDYEPLPFHQNTSDDMIAFSASPSSDFGVSTGILDLITGQASVHIIKRGLQIIDGVCKPARRLF